MNKRVRKALYDILYVVIVIGVLLGVWAASAAAVDAEFVLPDIAKTCDAFGTVFKNPNFWRGLAGTFVRSVIGYAVSLGLFSGLFRLAVAFDGFARVIEPIISALRSLPAVAVTLILTLVVGANGTPIVLGVLVIMPIMYSAARARVSTVPKELREVARLCGANKSQTFKALWFPCVAGGLPETLSSAFSYNIKAVVGAEILAQTADSLGMLMKLSQQYLQTATLIALVIVAVVVAVIAETVLRIVLRIALKKYVG